MLKAEPAHHSISSHIRSDLQRSSPGDSDENALLFESLRFDFDFWRADCDVVPRSLIVYVSEHRHYNNKHSNNWRRKRFYRKYSVRHYRIAANNSNIVDIYLGIARCNDRAFVESRCSESSISKTISRSFARFEAPKSSAALISDTIKSLALTKPVLSRSW